MTVAAKTPVWARADFIPLLQQGEHLTRYEFERRYHAMPCTKKAELIEGIVYMPSPVHHEGHGNPHSIIMGCLLLYTANTPGVDFSDHAFVPQINQSPPNEQES